MSKSIVFPGGYSAESSAEKKNSYYYDEAEAQRIIDFFAKLLKHGKGKMAGKPLILDEWQEDIVKTLYGWKRVADNTRRYRTAYIEVPRKNSKSTLCAGLALFHLIADKEQGAEVYSAAADKEQAKIVFNIACDMVKQSPTLSKMLEVYQNSIVCSANNGVYKALSSDSHTKHGQNPSAIIFDELHAQPNRELWDVLTTGFAAREQPLLISITTAGVAGDSICREQHDYAGAVRDGKIKDDTFLTVIYAAPDKADWDDEKVWAKANPGLGKSVHIEYLREQAKKAREIPAYQNTFRRLFLNQWTEQKTLWLPMSKWDKCSAYDILDIEDGHPCYAALDLSTTTDLSALVLVWRLKDKEGYLVEPHFFAPRGGVIEREKRDKVPYSQWAKDGFLHLTQGDVIDYDYIKKVVLDLSKKYNIKELSIDRWNATQLANQLDGEGLNICFAGMGYRSMTAPCRELEGLVVSGKLHHNKHPVLRWNAENISVEMDAAGNIKPAKDKSHKRIDGMVALIMALGRAIVAPDPAAKAVFNKGLRVI